MKRIVNALGKLSQGKRAYAVFALYAATATALSAQTFTIPRCTVSTEPMAQAPIGVTSYRAPTEISTAPPVGEARPSGVRCSILRRQAR